MDDPAEESGAAGPWEHGGGVSAESITEVTVVEAAASSGSGARERDGLRRPLADALVGGVCAGIADYLGVAALVVRLCFVGLVAASGIGLVIYPVAWAVMPVDETAARGGTTLGWRGHLSRWRQAVAIVVLGLVGLFGLRNAGLWFGDVVVWPLVMASAGVALIVRQVSPSGWVPGDALRSEGSARGIARRLGWREWPAAVIGVVLIAGAAVLFARNAGILVESRRAIGGIVVILVAVGLILGPWFTRLASSLASERSQRIRSQERAELAAHLHDSVLQTLALIQRRADDPREVAGLARRQERELRHWLFQRSDQRSLDTLVAELERAATGVEAMHGVRIEAVTVGDCGLDERLIGLVAAVREALTNAAKFAGEEQIDLYVEVSEERVEVFVRDRGVGFDPAAAAEDRRGVRHSILERMARHGGQAEIHSAPGQGTEVELVMQRRQP